MNNISFLQTCLLHGRFAVLIVDRISMINLINDLGITQLFHLSMRFAFSIENTCTSEFSFYQGYYLLSSLDLCPDSTFPTIKRILPINTGCLPPTVVDPLSLFLNYYFRLNSFAKNIS